MTHCRVLLPLCLLASITSAEVSAAGKQVDRNQLLEAASRAVTARSADLGIATGQPLQAASVHTSPLGSSIVTYQQSVGKYEVLGARVATLLDSGGTVRAVSGSFAIVESVSATAFEPSAAASPTSNP